jgi:hypothetical protein
MDQGLANVVAAAILVLGGTFFGGLIEARRSDRRAGTDRDWQTQQQKQQADREDARRREQWEREDGLAQRARQRDAYIRDLHATREQCLATLNLFTYQALGVRVDVAATQELAGEKYSNADVGLVGDRATVGLYFGTLARLIAHPAGTALGDDLQSACGDASAGVKARIREQEIRVNRDERPEYISAFALADMPPEVRMSPVILAMLQTRSTDLKSWTRNPEELPPTQPI